MKKMILTGIGSEQQFASNGLVSGSEYYLVFNNGELRVPVNQEAIQGLIEYMYGQQSEGEEVEEGEESEERDEVKTQSMPWGFRPQNGHGEVTDEDGVDQV